MNSTYLKIFFLVITILFLGCDDWKKPPLEDHHWTLASFKNAAGNLTEVPSQMASTLYFDSRTNIVTGTVRCNQFSSTYQASRKMIFIEELGVTEMWCGPDEEGQDQFVVEVLTNLGTYTIRNDTLRLRSKTGDILTYVLEEEVVPDEEILQIELSSSFGMCMGYCTKSMGVDPQTITLTQTGRPTEEYPDMSKEVPTTEERWNHLIALADLTAFNALPEVIGCPDCADGGAETIAITTAAGTKRVTIEFNAEIEEIEPLLAELRTLKLDLFAQMDEDESRIALEKNRALWEAGGIGNYQFTFRRFCECLPEEDIVVTVQSGRIVSAVYTPSEEPVSTERISYLDTIDELFDLIQEAVNLPAVRIAVQYDAADGYPADIYIDYDQNIADEEISYQIFDFKAL